MKEWVKAIGFFRDNCQTPLKIGAPADLTIADIKKSEVE